MNNNKWTKNSILQRSLLVLCILFSYAVKADHIMGGTMSYTCLGANNYKVDLTVYRDCNQSTGFDTEAYIGIYNSSGVLIRTESVNFPGSSNVPIGINNPCLSASSNLCVERADYSFTTNLPPLAGGYNMVYQRCCRNSAIVNITNPAQTGSTFFAHIPDPGIAICNSTPTFNQPPPAIMCAGYEFTWDYGATDPDGDSLVYEFVTPYVGGGPAPIDQQPNPPTAPPHATLNWSSGYNGNSQINASPLFAINQETGFVSGTPTTAGIHVFSVGIKEYRNGVLLDSIQRDFIVIIEACNIKPIIAGIGDQTDLCDGKTLSFQNTTTGATNYHWDFGDLTTNADTSLLIAPSYTYNDTGKYEVTLIANPDFFCADTTKKTFAVYDPITINIDPITDQCLEGNAFDFNCTGNFTANAQFSWNFGASATPTTSTNQQELQVEYATSGNKNVSITVQQTGCTKTQFTSFDVTPETTAEFNLDTDEGCEPLTINFSNVSIGATGYVWTLSDGSTDINTNPSSHTITNPGAYAIKLVASSPDGKCTDSSIVPVTVFDTPEISLNTATETCEAACNGTATVSIDNGGTAPFSYTWSGNNDTTTTVDSLCAGNIAVTVTDANGCTASSLQNIATVPPCCYITSASLINTSTCDSATNSYNATIEVLFTATPNQGYLVVIDNLTQISDTIYPPYTSPTQVTLNGLPANGNNQTISAFFSIDPNCGKDVNFQAPIACNCPANAGSSTISTTGSSINDYILCDGDAITITSNLDTTHAPGPNPGIAYAVFSCTPTFPIDIQSETCLVGIHGGSTPHFTSTNNGGSGSTLISDATSAGHTVTNNTLYLAPVTVTDINNNTVDPFCYKVGAITEVTYLNPIDLTIVENCDADRFEVTVNSGGYPEFYSDSYLISNIQPSHASVSQISLSPGDVFYITGLANGETASFDINDANNCSRTITTNAYNGIQITDTTLVDDPCHQSCQGSITITATGANTYSIDNGITWSSSNVFNTLCAGTYYLIASNGNCSDSITVTLTEPSDALEITHTTVQASCIGNCDGKITASPIGGTTPYSYLWDNGNTSPINNNLCVGTHQITVKDANECLLDSLFTIVDPAPFTFDTSSQNSSCQLANGWIAVSNISGGQSSNYTIDFGSGPSTTDTSFNLFPGQYPVTISDGFCDSTFVMTVNNTAPFTANISSISQITCNGLSNGSVTVEGSDPSATYSYQWTVNGTTVNSPTLNNLGPGSYSCTVTDQTSNCYDVIFVDIIEPPIISMVLTTQEDTICQNAPTNLTASASGGTGSNFTYTWDNGLGNGPIQQVQPNTPTVYTVWATDGNNCLSIPAVIKIYVHQTINFSTSPNDSICSGESTTLSANATGGNGPIDILWDNNSSTINQTVSPAMTTEYFVTASDACGTIKDSVLVYVYPAPNISFNVPTTDGCIDSPLEFINTTNPSIIAGAQWDFGDGNTLSSVDDTVTYAYGETGNFDISLTISTPPYMGSCNYTFTSPNLVTIHPDPIAAFNFSPEKITVMETTVDFKDLSNGTIQDWDWNFNGLGTSNLQHPTFQFPDDITGNYSIQLTVTDQYGCQGSTEENLTISGEGFSVFVPTAFSPNINNLNERFFPQGFGISPNDYQFMIFNRWGEKIFDTNQLFGAWDGRHKGQIVKNDVYVWRMIFKDLDGNAYEKTGKVTVVL